MASTKNQLSVHTDGVAPLSPGRSPRKKWSRPAAKRSSLQALRAYNEEKTDEKGRIPDGRIEEEVEEEHIKDGAADGGGVGDANDTAAGEDGEADDAPYAGELRDQVADSESKSPSRRRFCAAKRKTRHFRSQSESAAALLVSPARLRGKERRTKRAESANKSENGSPRRPSSAQARRVVGAVAFTTKPSRRRSRRQSLDSYGSAEYDRNVLLGEDAENVDAGGVPPRLRRRSAMGLAVVTEGAEMRRIRRGKVSMTPSPRSINASRRAARAKKALQYM